MPSEINGFFIIFSKTAFYRIVSCANEAPTSLHCMILRCLISDLKQICLLNFVRPVSLHRLAANEAVRVVRRVILGESGTSVDDSIVAFYVLVL